MSRYRNTGISAKDVRLRELALQERSTEELAHSVSLGIVDVPTCLDAPDEAQPWLAKAHHDAQQLYRDVAVAGDDGVELRALGSNLGDERRQTALKILRRSGAVTESKEKRTGSSRTLIVLRADLAGSDI